MNHYEVTFIVDPVLSGDEIKTTAQTYVDRLTGAGCSIVHVDEMGLRPLAYPINKRSSGVYYCVEFSSPDGVFMDELELTLRRDESIMRFLTVKLDKYGVKYNEDKRNGLIGKKKKKAAPPVVEPAPPRKEEEKVAKAEKPAAPAPVAEAEETPPVAEAEAPAPEPDIEAAEEKTSEE
jgi:small subunit ribosomal protein S6